jgi:large subunit ribosomal protein L10
MCSASDVEQISKLPGKDEMRSQFLGTLEAPLAQTLSVLEALLTSVMYCLENKSQANNS